jgi:transmembrane sensor
MARSLGPLGKLGERVAGALEAAAPERARALENARDGFLRHELATSAAARVFGAPLAWASVGAAVAGALASVLLIFLHHNAPLTFDVNGVAGVTKAWLAAPPSAAVDLNFSEGTRVRLGAASRARVVDIDAHGADLSLESGSVHAEVVHKSDSAWKVAAGPFTVSVTGTVFDVNWDPSSEQLVVSVSRGSVSVRESSTGAEQAVRAPETLRTTASAQHFDLTSAAPSSEPVASGAASVGIPENAMPDSTPADAHELAPNAPVDSGEPGPGKAESAVSEWREFAKRGALREAFASADAAGFSRTCASASPAELLLLGDGARLSGKPEQAILALLTLRRRYPSDPRRAAAAFALGKVSFDQRGAYEQAAEWFSTSLREQPNGPLAREASGRLIEALRRADDSAGARRAARDYLSKYPEGPHADLARSLLR